MPTRAGPPAPPFAAIEPMLFVESRQPVDDASYVHEIKYDGWRLLAEADSGRVTLKTRNGADATKWFPEITSTLVELQGGRHVLDGELCVLDDIGRSDFERLQTRARMRGYRPGCDLVVFCVFDLLVHAGQDLRTLPLTKRKAKLARLLRKKMSSVLLVTGVPGDQGTWLYEQMLAVKAEGIVSKRLDSPYLSGERSAAWLKVKRPGAVPAQRFKR